MSARKPHITRYIIIFAAIALIAVWVYVGNYTKSVVKDGALSNATINSPRNTASNINTSTTGQLPNEFSLKIPFTSQAPTGNWDTLHNEACEEASAIMASAYVLGDTRTTLPAGEVEKQITNLTEWQDQNFGYHLDTTTQETAQMISQVYKLKATVVQGIDETTIKKELNAGHVVILPVNGRDINNPNYKQPGPIYHMLVVRGYSGDTIITNDSGTRNGQNYKYAFNTLRNAGVDWDHSTDTIDQSKKLMIIVSK